MLLSCKNKIMNLIPSYLESTGKMVGMKARSKGGFKAGSKRPSSKERVTKKNIEEQPQEKKGGHKSNCPWH